MSVRNWVAAAAVFLGMSVTATLAREPDAGVDVRATNPVKSLIRVEAGDALTRGVLRQTLSDWDVAGTTDAGRSLDLVVTAADIERLTDAGVAFEVVVPDMVAAADEVRASYHTFPEFEALISDLATNYPAITQLTSIGQSYEGREIWCLEISDNPGVDEGETGVVFMGLHHAREWPSLEVPLDIATRLTANYDSDPNIAALVDDRRIWVIPCVNPDGYVYDHDQGHDWRKNRRPIPGTSEIGVDLNRNYDGSWDGSMEGEWGAIGDARVSHMPGSEVYCGTGPFSEPETQAVRDFLEPLDFTIALSYHTYSRLVLWPWNYAALHSPYETHLVSLGTGLADTISQHGGDGAYTPQQGIHLYPTAGDFTDWCHGYFLYGKTQNTLPYTIELAPEFHPPASWLVGILDANWYGALYILEQASSVASQLPPPILPPILTTPATDLDGDFTISWHEQNPEAGASFYAVQELVGPSLVTDDVESGDGGWIMQGMAITASRAHSGAQSFGVPFVTEHVVGMDTAIPLEVQPGDVLSFWTWYDLLDYHNIAYVELCTDGHEYHTLGQFTGDSGGWIQKTYDLAPYIGQWCYLRFRYVSDFATFDTGFYIDDIYPAASWDGATTQVVGGSETSLQITGREPGEYLYRVLGYSPAYGFGDYCVPRRTVVVAEPPTGDCNCDGSADVFDIDAFVMAILFPAEYAATYPDCDILLADCDGDGSADIFDIDAFIAAILGR